MSLKRILLNIFNILKFLDKSFKMPKMKEKETLVFANHSFESLKNLVFSINYEVTVK
jgi:hypothetical protein